MINLHNFHNQWLTKNFLAPLYIENMIGRPLGKFGQDAGVTPLLVRKTSIFCDYSESGPRFNVSSQGWCFL